MTIKTYLNLAITNFKGDEQGGWKGLEFVKLICVKYFKMY